MGFDELEWLMGEWIDRDRGDAREPERKAVEVCRPVRETAWSFVATIALPGGTDLGIYQPKRPSPG